MKKMILCCDTGIDDALAIAYAGAQNQMELIGIVASYGVTYLKNAYRNTKKILELLHLSIPVYMGSERPLKIPLAPRKGTFHGDDGMGNLLGTANDDDAEDARREEGIDFMMEQIHKYKKDLTIVTTGTLTDIAKVISRDPSVIKEIGQVVSMIGAVATPGNINKFAEVNAAYDPDAAKLVMESGLPLTVVGLDVTRKTLLSTKDLDRWKAIGTEASDFFYRSVSFYLGQYKKFHPYLAGCALHDPLAVGVAINESLVTTIPMHLTVITEGEALGETTEDLKRVNEENYQTKVAMFVKGKEFEKDFFNTVDRVLS